MLRLGRLTTVVVSTFLIGCVVVLVVSASGVRAETSQEEKQGHTETTNTEQGHSGGADRCDKTRTIVRISAGYLTNDLPGCPNKGGLLSAKLPDTGKRKITSPNYGLLMGEKGDDVIRGGSEVYGGEGNDVIYARGGAFIEGQQGDDVIHGGNGGEWYVSGGDGNDVIYGRDGNDFMNGNQGEDVLYGGDGNDHLGVDDGQRDKLYCGAGKDKYSADTIDYVDSSCEKGKLVDTGGPPLLMLAGALLLGSGILTYAILRRG